LIFSEFCKIFVFIEKEKSKEKEKFLHGLGPTHNKGGPTARIQPRLKTSPGDPLKSEHFASGILIYFKNY
jgi:hypothetical protein